MATVVFLHAHPDDEAILTGGTMARAAEAGHRVVLVVATDGAHGESPEDLAPGETLVARRQDEVAAAAEVLGVARVAWLGYTDSGMTGWAQNSAPDAFVNAPLDEAVGRLAAVLAEEAADVLVTYDWHGNYGHPDHVMVHRISQPAAMEAVTPTVFEATMNRDALRRMMEMARATGDAPDSGAEGAEGVEGGESGEDFDPDGPADDGNPFGTAEEELTHGVDVRDYLDRKRAALTCHRSQISDTSYFLQMPDAAFAAAFGTEWFIEVGAPAGLRKQWILDEVAP